MKLSAFYNNKMMRTLPLALLAFVVSIAIGQTSPVKAANSANTLPSIVDVVKKVMPAVVNISTTRVVQTESRSPFPFFNGPFNRHPFGKDPFQRKPRKHREGSLGSGVIVDSSGYIITNNHVIANADEIKVVLADKREFKGKVIGTDPKTDIAIIKISGKNLPTIPWGDSDKLEVGRYVLAIGSPLGLSQTVTMGIVSAKGRANVGIADYEDFIQTDAAINPGNSGGALVNIQGELIGINTAIFSRSGGNMGIGFAVPSNMARNVMRALIKDGKVIRGWFGVSIQEVTPGLAKQFGLKKATGALVSETISGTPAAKAGIEAGDVILEFNGKKVKDATTLRHIVAATKVGKRVKVRIVRNKKVKIVYATITELPKQMARKSGEQNGSAAGTALAGIKVRNLTAEIASQLGVDPNTAGVLVGNVEVGTPAEKAGLQPGDIILAMTRRRIRSRIRSLDDYRKLASKLGKSDAVLVWIIRRGSRRFIPIEP